MKKLVALLAALMMLGCMSAMAETTDTAEYDLSGVGSVGLTVTEAATVKENVFAMNGADTATITNEACTVYSDNMIIKLDKTQGSFMIFTQDFMASYIDYVMAFSDPQGVNQSIIEDDIHLLILDKMYNDQYELLTCGSINMKGALGTLSMLPENVQIQLGNTLAVQLGGVYGGIVKYNNVSWVKVAEECYFTLVDGNVLLLRGAHLENGNCVPLMPGSCEMMMMALNISLAE